jgi:hypothetical protein
MDKNFKLVGSIDLAALNNVEFLRLQDGRKVLAIPVDANPCIFVTTPKDNQKRKALLDVNLIPTPNSKFKNTHMAKASVGKTNMEAFGLDRNNRQQMDQYEPIIGNFKALDPIARNAQGGPDPMDAGGDMPAEIAGVQAPSAYPETW